MDFDNAKENIQPLAAGRNANILQASLRCESAQELLAQRRELEQEIRNYVGDDPLEPWYSYITWIEQSFPSGGKESGLEEVLKKCLARFEDDAQYFQDRRMVKLYIKFIDSHKNPTDCYQKLYNAGIGTMIADFYISWAYYYELANNTRMANEIFNMGIACRAEPFDDLEAAHKHFVFAVGQRVIHVDDELAKEKSTREMMERRLALTSLRGHGRRATVGSLRTGNAVKSYLPGTLKVEMKNEKHNKGHLKVFSDENKIPAEMLPTSSQVVRESSPPEGSKSVIRAIIETADEVENEKEPGPWNNVHHKKKHANLYSKTTGSNDLGFSIHQDEPMKIENKRSICTPLNPPIENYERNFEKPFKYPQKLPSKNRSQPMWSTPVTIETSVEARSYPQYNKSMLYPRPNKEFQVEELLAYKWFKRRGISNAFTQERDPFWSTHDINSNVRQYPNFVAKSKPQTLDKLDKFFIPEIKFKSCVKYNKIYDQEAKEEYSFEELKAQRWKSNQTNIKVADMEETICFSNERMPRRKSFFPSRKSIAPASMFEKESKPMAFNLPNLEEENSRKSNFNVHEKEPQFKSLKNSSTSKNVETFENNASEIKIQEDAHNALPPTTEALPVNLHEKKEFKTLKIFEDKEDEKCDFEFKTPAVVQKTTKIPFEIYEETKLPSVPHTEKVSIFDPEETCSTQMFNIYIKSQSVSTPVAPHKAGISRQSGPMFKNLPPPPFQLNDENDENLYPHALLTNNQDTENNENAVTTSTEGIFSPLQKQLSTILETSEHGTTQGTHTTGASTKSTFSSPELEHENHMVRPTELAPLAEQSEESSFAVNSKIEEMMDTMRLQSHLKINRTTDENVSIKMKPELNTIKILTTTPLINRIQNCEAVNINKSTADDTKDQVGTFSRFEQREDTATGFIVPSLRFQEDKTETVPKVLLTSKVLKFQEDKTETISKALFGTHIKDSPEKLEHGAIHNASLKSNAEIEKEKDLDDSLSAFFLKTPPSGGYNFNFPNVQSPKPIITKRICIQATPTTKDEPNDLLDVRKCPPQNDSLSIFEDDLNSTKLIDLKSKSSVSVSSFTSKPKQMPSKSKLSLGKHSKSERNTIPLNAESNKQTLGNEQDFEQNAETAMFSTNISMIKNSTWLPTYEPIKKEQEKEQKREANLSKSQNKINESQNRINQTQTTNLQQHSTNMTNTSKIIEPYMKFECSSSMTGEPDQNDSHEKSIYFKETPKTPVIQKHIWDDHLSSDESSDFNNKYVHTEVDLNQTHQIIENICVDAHRNPFNVELNSAFLDRIEFIAYINDKLESCELLNRIPRLYRDVVVHVHSDTFKVLKLIGEGAYGAVFLGIHTNTGKKVALKQERPSNLWEYYICLEVHSRLNIDDMRQAFMNVDYALIGKNASILISPFCQYGSLITVCNKVKKYTTKNIDEYIVMYLVCELLEILDHLHALEIIHADIKADNILLMKKLTYPSKERLLQLVDFGVSIDMKCYKKGQTFSYVHNDNAFKCIEMREQRSWTYQLDLFGLAGIIHVLLFGKYMEVEKRSNGIWMHKTHMPRYLCKTVWDTIFKNLLNIPDCSSMPNLQQLRTMLKEEIAEKEKYLVMKLSTFNSALDT